LSSSKEPPVVQFALLGETYYVTDYVQVENPHMKAIAENLNAKNIDEAIERVLQVTCGELAYPLNWRAAPAIERHIKIFKWWDGFFLTDEGEKRYGWLLPNQIAVTRKGICIDTACFCGTLLRILKVDAYVVLGAILDARTKKILGFHAWVVARKSDGKQYLLETTVHPVTPPPIPVEDAYKGKLKIIYDPIVWFNETEYHENEEKVKKYERILEQHIA